MKVRVGIYWGLLAGAAFVSLAFAQEDIWTKTINNDSNGVWNVQPKARYVNSPGVPGEKAMRVKATKGRNPWDVQAGSPIAGEIKQGDVIMLMIYVRAEKPAEGGSTLSVRVQLSGEPYTTTMEFAAPISGEWKSYCAHRVASNAMPAGKSNVSIHLATADQTIDLGPVFVFNFGPGYDLAKLKSCNDG